MAHTRSSVLLVEDDQDLGKVLAQFLELSGFSVCHAMNAKAGLARFAEAPTDFCILDVGLPDMDGFELAKRMKASRPELRFLFLTARVLKPDRLRGLEMGADDYITKPFEADELVLRIRNILRRGGRSEDGSVSLGTFAFDPETRVLRRNEEEQTLSRKDGELLKLLAENRNRLVTRSDILNAVWGKEDYFLGRSMDVYVTRLRKLLAGDPSITIESVRGAGFILRIQE